MKRPGKAQVSRLGHLRNEPQLDTGSQLSTRARERMKSISNYFRWLFKSDCEISSIFDRRVSQRDCHRTNDLYFCFAYLCFINYRIYLPYVMPSRAERRCHRLCLRCRLPIKILFKWNSSALIWVRLPLHLSLSLSFSLSLSPPLYLRLHDDDEALLSSCLLSLFVFVDFVSSHVFRFRALIMEVVIPSPTLYTPSRSEASLSSSVSLSPHPLLLIVN